MGKKLAQTAATQTPAKLAREIKLPASAQPMRVDTLLSAPEFFHISRTRAQKLIEAGDVFVNGTSVLKKSLLVKPNDTVSIALNDDTPAGVLAPPPKETKVASPPPKDDEVEEEGEGEEEGVAVSAADAADVEDEDELEGGPKQTTGAPLIVPIDTPINFLYEDESIAVVLKEPGLVVHPGRVADPSLAAALLHKYGREGLSWAGGLDRPGIVHRLDKDTTGLMVIAKNDEIHMSLQKQFAEHSAQYAKIASNFSPYSPLPVPDTVPVLRKKYIAIVAGKPKEDHGFIVKGIAHNRKERHKMQVSDTGKEAVTEYKIAKVWKTRNTKKWRSTIFSLLDITIHTGRTHQIRVHMASQGHPIIGDPLYSRRWNAYDVPFLLLASTHLQFLHPAKPNTPLSFETPVPTHIKNFMEVLDKMKIKEG